MDVWVTLIGADFWLGYLGAVSMPKTGVQFCRQGEMFLDRPVTMSTFSASRRHRDNLWTSQNLKRLLYWCVTAPTNCVVSKSKAGNVGEPSWHAWKSRSLSATLLLYMNISNMQEVYGKIAIFYGSIDTSHPIRTTCATQFHFQADGVWVFMQRTSLKLQRVLWKEKTCIIWIIWSNILMTTAVKISWVVASSRKAMIRV